MVSRERDQGKRFVQQADSELQRETMLQQPDERCLAIDELTVKIASEAAVGAGDYRRACGAIRKTITWDMVYACV